MRACASGRPPHTTETCQVAQHTRAFSCKPRQKMNNGLDVDTNRPRPIAPTTNNAPRPAATTSSLISSLCRQCSVYIFFLSFTSAHIQAFQDFTHQANARRCAFLLMSMVFDSSRLSLCFVLCRRFPHCRRFTLPHH